MHKVYRKLETGYLYRYLHLATLSTNGQEGKHMVVYEDNFFVYVTDAEEFYRKFEIVYDPSI